jgi:hypothetical protein
MRPRPFAKFRIERNRQNLHKDRGMSHLRLNGLLGLLATAIFGSVFASQALAQSAPAGCKPNAGATAECASEILTPYIFLNASCASSQYLPSGSASEALWDSQYNATYTSCPGAIFTGQGFATSPMCFGGACSPPSLPIVSAACQGGPYTFPTNSTSGRELNNWLVYQVSGN